MAALSLFVRMVHVVAMAVLLGGAVLAWGQLRGTDSEASAPSQAVAYEWLFWGGVGAAVLTGVGNLGAMAPGVPGPGTDWGVTLAVKLGAVAVLLVGSVVRTLAVSRAATIDEPPAGTTARLRAGYAATAGWLLVVLALAEVLAHG